MQHFSSYPTAKMSFGFGIGDFITVARLTESIRKSFANAPEQYKAISSE
jgi:hypothetical protein